MRAAVYARYSSHEQGEQSIEGQLPEAHCYATEHDMTMEWSSYEPQSL